MAADRRRGTPVLGWVVGKRSTPIDDWFLWLRDSPARWLLFFTDPWVLALVLMGVVAVALYQRRWRLAAMALARFCLARRSCASPRRSPDLTGVNPACDPRHSES